MKVAHSRAPEWRSHRIVGDCSRIEANSCRAGPRRQPVETLMFSGWQRFHSVPKYAAIGARR